MDGVMQIETCWVYVWLMLVHQMTNICHDGEKRGTKKKESED